MQMLTSASNFQADIRWEKGKDWRKDRRQETETIEVIIDDVGKLLLNAEYITLNELHQHLK